MRFLSPLALALTPTLLAFAAEPAVRKGPTIEDGKLVYPEGADIPRSLTPAEREYLKSHPLPSGPFTDRVGGVRPPGPIQCPGEYAPCQAILMSWDGTTAQNNILATMAKHITTTGNADVYMVVDTAAEQTSVASSLTSAGANMARVKFFVRTTDSIWIRDYGPRFIYIGTRNVPGQGAVRGIVDHVYNRPRPNDDAFPAWFGPSGFATKKFPVYDLGMTHGGGNFHLDSIGRSFATELIENENTSLSPTDIINTWHDFQNVNTTILPPFPTSIDSTQHIDMWMQIISDNRVIISDWPSNAGSTQDVICDNAATTLTSMGYTVFRTPARSLGGVHYTYANMVVCNNLVLLPTYTNSTMTNAGHNTQALNAVSQAFDFDNNGTPDKTIVQIPCDALASAAGVMHCIVMHVPAAAGAPGVNGQGPSAHISVLNSAATLAPGQNFQLNWLTDDDKDIGTIDLSFSANGGVSFPLSIASNIADTGTRSWTVPNIPTAKGRIRITVRDLDGNVGTDISDADFTISGTPCPWDLNLDRQVDDLDFVLFAGAYEELTSLLGDFNGDGSTDDSDFVLFANAYDLFLCP
ncbi:MAG: agmatine deiminase family protein [Phycisphaerales bacterium]|nr:agmatine deiminase family protein [Planctomycetota bacterium]